MFFWKICSIVGLSSVFVGLVWCIKKIGEDDRKKLFVPFACFCWGFVLLIGQVVFRKDVFLFDSGPIDLGIGVFLIVVGISFAILPVILWLISRRVDKKDDGG
ncbi:MAG: hypothetical protein ABIG88_00600 [Patescibacteria group bacterium]|nr:hypothetical protein [Patescibacteria group bacterium]